MAPPRAPCSAASRSMVDGSGRATACTVSARQVRRDPPLSVSIGTVRLVSGRWGEIQWVQLLSARPPSLPSLMHTTQVTVLYPSRRLLGKLVVSPLSLCSWNARAIRLSLVSFISVTLALPSG
eukprot:5301588-Pyramimonas_sp.AAC.1